MTEAVDKKRAILVKIESSYGSDPSATGGSNALLARIGGWRPQQSVYASRSGIAIPALGEFAGKTAYQWAELDLEVEVSGAAAAGTAPPYGPLLRAAGMSETIVANTSVTYAPISASHESAAVYANVDGMRQLLLGWRSGLGISFRNEEIPFYRFGGKGLYATPTDTALPALTLTGHQGPVPVNRSNTTTSSLHSYTVGLEELDIDLGLEVVYKSTPGGTNKMLIVNRKPTGRITIEHPTLAQKDYNAIVASGATGALSIVHTGGAAGKILTLTASQVRLTNPVPGNNRGVRTLSMDLEFAPSNSLNDELSLAYT